MRQVPPRSRATTYSRYCRDVRPQRARRAIPESRALREATDDRSGAACGIGALALLALIACGSSKESAPEPAPTPAPAPSAVTVKVDRRIELVSIVFRLADAPEYRTAPPQSPYVQAVDTAFRDFATHPAVARTRELRKQGISYDAPIHLAVHLDDQLNPFGLDELAAIDKRWTGIDVAAYAAQLRAFATESKLDEFLAGQGEYFSRVESTLRTVVERENAGAWFDSFFGPREKSIPGAAAPRSDFVVIPGPLNGTRNFGSRATVGGTLRMYQVLGILRGDGIPATDEQTVSLLVHEMAHSYVNPLFERQHDKLEASGRHLFSLVESQMVRQAYRDWQTMLNESGVRAVTTLYMREKYGDAAGARAARSEQRLGFVWTNELVDVLRQIRATKQPVATHMAKVIQFFNLTTINYRTGLPKLPFLGPINAAMQQPVFVVSTELANYVTTVRDQLFADSPLALATDKTLGEHPGRHLLAYGSPSTNAVVKNMLGHAQIKIEEDAITLGKKRFDGPGLVLVFARFRWDEPSRGVVVYTAARDRDLVDINHKLTHGERDWVVARRTAKGFEVLESADFERAVDGAWLLP